MALIINGSIKTGLAVAVAMKIAKTNVARVGNFHRPWKRLIGTDDAVAVEIGESNVVGRINFNRQCKPAFAPFLFGLQRVKAPMGGIARLNFVADMMLARNLVGAAFSLGVGDEHTSLGKGRGRPKVEERAAAAVGDPEAWVLAVPMAIWVGIGGVIVVIWILAGTVRQGRAVATKEANVVHR